MAINDLRSMPSIMTTFRTMIFYVKKPLYSWLIRRSDIFHPISNAMGDYFAGIGIKKDRIFPLPLCPAKSMIDTEVKERKTDGNTFNMIYIGQVSPVRKIEFLFDIVKELKQKTNRELKLQIVGKITIKKYKNRLLERIDELGLKENIELINEVKFAEITSYIDESDLGLSILPPILSYRVSSPTKVGEYLSRGIPVVANKEIEDQRMMVESSKGGSVPGYSLDEITDDILKYINDAEHDIIRRKGTSGREWVLKNRNYRKLADDLKGFYRKRLDRT